LLSWQAASKAYSEAVSNLVNGLDVCSTDEYELLKRQAENTRFRAADTRNAFELHVEEHGC